MKKSTHHESAQMGVAFFVILLAAGVFFLFYSYKDAIFLSGNIGLFLTLTTVAFALLVTLVYLAFNSKPHHKEAKAKASVKSSKSKTVSKKKKK